MASLKGKLNFISSAAGLLLGIFVVQLDVEEPKFIMVLYLMQNVGQYLLKIGIN